MMQAICPYLPTTQAVIQAAASTVKMVATASLFTGTALATYTLGNPYGIYLPLTLGITFATAHLLHAGVYVIVAQILDIPWRAGFADHIAKPMVVTAFITAAVFAGFSCMMTLSGFQLCFAALKAKSFLLFIDGVRNFTTAIGFAIPITAHIRGWTFDKIKDYLQNRWVTYRPAFDLDYWRYPGRDVPRTFFSYITSGHLTVDQTWLLMQTFPERLSLDVVWERIDASKKDEYLVQRFQKCREDLEEIGKRAEDLENPDMDILRSDTMRAAQVHSFLSSLPKGSVIPELNQHLGSLAALCQRAGELSTQLDDFQTKKLKELYPDDEAVLTDPLQALWEAGLRPIFEIRHLNIALGLEDPYCQDANTICTKLAEKGIHSKRDLLTHNILASEGYNNGTPEDVNRRLIAFIKKEPFDPPQRLGQVKPSSQLTGTSRKIALFANFVFQYTLILGATGLQLYYNPVGVAAGIMLALLFPKIFLRLPNPTLYWQSDYTYFPSFVERCRQISSYILQAQIVRLESWVQGDGRIAIMAGIGFGENIGLEAERMVNRFNHFVAHRLQPPPMGNGAGA